MVGGEVGHDNLAFAHQPEQAAGQDIRLGGTASLGLYFYNCPTGILTQIAEPLLQSDIEYIF